MYCRQCGQLNEDSATQCVRCGLDMLPRLLETKPIRSHLVFAILVTILCCLPAGIPAIVYAARVDPRAAAGDIAGARDAADKAWMWCWIGFGVGLLGSAAYVAFVVVTMAMGNR